MNLPLFIWKFQPCVIWLQCNILICILLLVFSVVQFEPLRLERALLRQLQYFFGVAWNILDAWALWGSRSYFASCFLLKVIELNAFIVNFGKKSFTPENFKQSGRGKKGEWFHRMKEKKESWRHGYFWKGNDDAGWNILVSSSFAVKVVVRVVMPPFIKKKKWELCNKKVHHICDISFWDKIIIFRNNFINCRRQPTNFKFKYFIL